eukprot:scaffold62528_cov59-Phaeocystis_antarctica.AAC.2
MSRSSKRAVPPTTPRCADAARAQMPRDARRVRPPARAWPLAPGSEFGLGLGFGQGLGQTRSNPNPNNPSPSPKLSLTRSQTRSKLAGAQKLCVTASAVSRLITTCHQPPGTNTVSPGA